VSDTAVSVAMELVLYYCNAPVWSMHVDNTSGCRVYYGDGDLLSWLETLPSGLATAVCHSVY